jgi:hypothetical protein
MGPFGSDFDFSGLMALRVGVNPRDVSFAVNRRWLRVQDEARMLSAYYE